MKRQLQVHRHLKTSSYKHYVIQRREVNERPISIYAQLHEHIHPPTLNTIYKITRTNLFDNKTIYTQLQKHIYTRSSLYINTITTEHSLKKITKTNTRAQVLKNKTIYAQ